MDQELSTRAGSVLADANAHKTDLAAYNVTQTKIDDLSAAVDRFNSVRTSPRTAVAERVAQTQTIPALIRDTNTLLLEEIDPLVNLFQPTHGEFVSGYRAARVIVDRAATRKPSTAPQTGNEVGSRQ